MFRPCGFLLYLLQPYSWRQMLNRDAVSDVSEFEHIYGQIFTTPSCVYECTTDSLNEQERWILMTFIFPIKSSSWALTAAYTKFRRMIWSMIWSRGHRSRSPMCTVTSSQRRETSLGKSRKHITLWFPGGSSHYRCWSAILVTSTTAMTQPPPLLSFCVARSAFGRPGCRWSEG